MLHGNAWNKAVASATIEALVSSLKLLNKETQLQYRWPHYLESLAQAHGTIFEGFFRQAHCSTPTRGCDESQVFSFEKLKILKHVPVQFADGRQPPKLLLTRLLESRSLPHDGYMINDLRPLKIIEQTAQGFLRRLREYIFGDISSFRQKPSIWHS